MASGTGKNVCIFLSTLGNYFKDSIIYPHLNKMNPPMTVSQANDNIKEELNEFVMGFVKELKDIKKYDDKNTYYIGYDGDGPKTPPRFLLLLLLVHLYLNNLINNDNTRLIQCQSVGYSESFSTLFMEQFDDFFKDKQERIQKTFPLPEEQYQQTRKYLNDILKDNSKHIYHMYIYNDKPKDNNQIIEVFNKKINEFSKKNEESIKKLLFIETIESRFSEYGGFNEDGSANGSTALWKELFEEMKFDIIIYLAFYKKKYNRDSTKETNKTITYNIQQNLNKLYENIDQYTVIDDVVTNDLQFLVSGSRGYNRPGTSYMVTGGSRKSKKQKKQNKKTKKTSKPKTNRKTKKAKKLRTRKNKNKLRN